MSKRKIRIGLVGYQFMGKAHSNAYRQAPRFFELDWEPELAVICGRNETALKQAAQKFGWQAIETDWRKLVERKDLDLIDVSTPGHLHAPISLPPKTEKSCSAKSLSQTHCKKHRICAKQ